MESPLPVPEFERRVRAIATAPAAQDTFAAAFHALALVAPRGAIHIVRRDGLRVWNLFGYSEPAAAALRAHEAAGSSWLDGLAAVSATAVALREPGGGEPGLGPPCATSAVAPVIVRDRAVALLLVERDEDEAPWSPAALGVIATVTALRLALSLAERQVVAGRSPEAETGLSPVEEIERRPEHEAARRFARLVATDIRLYHEEAVLYGRQNGDLLQRLGESLDRGNATFLDRHADLGDDALRLLHEAYVEVLAGGNTSLIPLSAIRR